MFKYFFASITRNALSLAGTALALGSLVLIISLVVIQLLGYEGGPYLGIVTFLVLPGLAIIGLIMIPIGALLWRQKMRKSPEGHDISMFPVFDLNESKTRKWTLIFVGITVVNVVILSGATYSGIHHMESVEFCGLACHSVMEPEFTAHALGPHSLTGSSSPSSMAPGRLYRSTSGCIRGRFRRHSTICGRPATRVNNVTGRRSSWAIASRSSSITKRTRRTRS